MRCLQVYRDVDVDPATIASGDRALLAHARDDAVAILHVYGFRGDVLGLGRYHVVPTGSGTDVRVTRRLSGGRAMPLGDGFIGVSLALRHRSALVADEALVLAPAQVLNRAVRGLLGALDRFGMTSHYPGRDVVTVGGRIIAAMAFEVAPQGETLVEIAVATGRSFAAVTGFADRADPGGIVPIDAVSLDEATCIADVCGRTPDVDAMAQALADGYAERLGLVCTDAMAPRPAAVADPDWLRAGSFGPELGGHARRREMLGVVEAYVACAEGRLEAVRLCGDFIAPSGTVARIEAALRGSPIARPVLVERVRRAARGPDDFVLGLRSLDVFAEVVAEACHA